MSQLLRLKLAKQRGEALLTEEDITRLAVDPFDLAQRHEIKVQAKPDVAQAFRECFCGMVIRLEYSMLRTFQMRDSNASALHMSLVTIFLKAISIMSCPRTACMLHMPVSSLLIPTHRRLTVSPLVF